MDMDRKKAAEGLSMKNFTSKSERTDLVLMGYEKAEEYGREVLERTYGVLPREYGLLPDDLLS